MKDEKLIAECQRAAAIYLRNPSTAITHRYLGSASLEDIAQEAIIKILSAKPDKITRAYIAMTVKSVCVDITRKGSLQIEDTPVLPENTKEWYDLLSIEDKAEEILSTLDQGQRELFDAIYIHGHSTETLGTYLGVTDRTIRRKLQELRIVVEDIL